MEAFVRESFRLFLFFDLFKSFRILSRRNCAIFILDVSLCTFDLQQVLVLIRKLNRNVHIILIADDEEKLSAAELQGSLLNHLHFKPVDTDHLRKHLTEIIPFLTKQHDRTIEEKLSALPGHLN
jgi:DNA-binding NtrC family response regulator